MTPTIQQIIDEILNAIPDSVKEDTVDMVKCGDPNQHVTGIATTFLASQSVLERARQLGVNFIITHEPTFYNHLDNVDWLAEDPVYQTKYEFIKRSKLVIWRFHDNWHIHQPDGLLQGIVEKLNWGSYKDPQNPAIFHIPSTKLEDLVLIIKDKLGIKTLRIVGNLEMECQKIGVLVGAWGGSNQIPFMRKTNLDILICGEIAEWETSEYVRDAVNQGRKQALIITGHANSEEPGMEYLVSWLEQRFPGLPVHHIPVGDPFVFV
jgi:putative NIF3 family GTP cyclohydrolase 1 type 2